ncbi:hypothetical protein [Burkholderia cepacia]|uniref:hypothetical protein n=1 Tax=Burkholderia cepacia TaxID=292 RepID=UPI0021AB3267|nr:hypothetical protein [Burkholderia cepacia]
MSTLAQIRSRPVMKPAVKAKNASVNRMKSRSLMTSTDIFRIPVESRRSIPLGFDQCMKQIDKERERQRAGDPQHGFPLFFVCAATPRDRRRGGPCLAGAGPCDAPMLVWRMGCDSVEIRVSKRCSISLQGIKKP